MSVSVCRPWIVAWSAVWRRPGRALAAVALLLIIGMAWHVAARQLSADHHAVAAREALARRDYEQARLHLDTSLRIRPHSAEFHLIKARLARLAGSSADAERALKEAQHLGASAQAVTLERALLEAQQGELTLDLEGYLRDLVNQGHPDTTFILEALSQGYTRSYRLKHALDCLNLWLQERPDDLQALMGRGWVLERLDQFEKARDDYLRATEVAPDNPDAELRLAQVLLLLGDPQKALGAFEHAWQRQAGQPAVGLGLAQCYSKLGRNEEARELLDRLAADHPEEGAILLERGHLALQMGQPAESWLRKAVADLPHDYNANYDLWQCLLHLGNEAEAREARARVDSIQADLMRMRELTDQLQQRPYDSSLRCEIAQIFLRQGEKREGLLWLEAALRMDPRDRSAHLTLADYYEQNGEPALAAQHRRLANPQAGPGLPN